MIIYFIIYSCRIAKRIAATNLSAFRSTPHVTPATRSADCTLACRSEPGSQSSEDDDLAESGGDKLNSVATNVGPVSPLTFQLKTEWNDTSEDEKDVCIDKAMEAYTLVCDVIAPNAGQELFQSCFTPNEETKYAELVPLMQAYSNSTTRNVKTRQKKTSEDASEDP